MTDVFTRACASDGVAWKTDDSLCVCLMHLLSSVRGQPHSVTYIPLGVPGQRGEDAGWQPWLKDSKPLRVSECVCVCACRVSGEGFIHTSETSICPSPCCSQDLRSRMMPDTELQWETEQDHSKLWHLYATLTHFPLTTIFCSKCCWYSKLIGQFRQCVSESGGFYSPSVSDNTAIGARAGDETLKWITGDWDYRCRWSTRGDNEVCEDLRISLCTAILLWLRTKRRRAQCTSFWFLLFHSTPTLYHYWHKVTILPIRDLK